MKGLRSAIPLLLALTLAGLAVLFWLPAPPRPVSEPPAAEAGPPPPLSPFAAAPDWDTLAPWQETLRRDDFLTQMDRVYTTSPAWRNWFHLGANDVLIETGTEGENFQLRFAQGPSPDAPPRGWRQATESS